MCQMGQACLQPLLSLPAPDSHAYLEGAVRMQGEVLFPPATVSELVQAAMGGRLGSLTTDMYFLRVLEAGSLRSRCCLIWFLVRALSCRWSFSHQGGEGKQELWYFFVFLYGAKSIMKAPLSWPHWTLITSQRSNLQIPSRWGLGFQHKDLGGIQTFSPHHAVWWESLCLRIYVASTLSLPLYSNVEGEFLLL